MIAKVLQKKKLGVSDYAQDLAYWLSRAPEERVAFVEELRREYWGNPEDDIARLQRSLTVVKRGGS